MEKQVWTVDNLKESVNHICTIILKGLVNLKLHCNHL